MTIWIADIETDGLKSTKIHVLSVSDTSGKIKKSTNSYDEMRKFLTNAKVIVGHYFSIFDITALEKLLDIKYTGRIVDTLALSWILFPGRARHGLEAWGEELGVLKPEILDWENLTYEEYKHRCETDVEINRLLWQKCYRYLFDLYGSEKKIWEYLDYIAFKMYCARLQEESGWHVDIPRAEASVARMVEEKERKVIELKKAMPDVPKTAIREKPKKFFKKDGSFSSKALEWNRLVAEHGLPADHSDPIEVITKYEEPNPASPDQIKKWLFSLGWEPKTFKYVKQEDGSTKAIPQINLEHGKGICKSIQILYEKEPRLEVLDGLSILNHRIPLLQGIIDSVEDEKTKAQIQGITNTLRFQHATVVNLPKVEKPYGEDIRGALIAPEGYILCGSDMASLEDRIKQHYIYPYDPDYVNSMNQEDFDPHLTIAGLAGMLTQEEIDEYKRGNKKNKPVRDIAKGGNYACQYNAGPPRLVIACGISLDQAKKLHQAYWDLNWAVKKVASVQVIKEINGQMWLKNPLNGFYYSLRKRHDVFSTLVQGTASYVFDMWVKNILDKRPQLTATYHDEIILCIKEGFEKQCEELINYAIDKLNKDYKFNRELGVSIQFSKRYSEIH